MCVQSITLGLFLRAEDGIRLLPVTGVQTCALPISGQFVPPLAFPRLSAPSSPLTLPTIGGLYSVRSEVRRVGKEARYPESAYHQKIKTFAHCFACMQIISELNETEQPRRR